MGRTETTGRLNVGSDHCEAEQELKLGIVQVAAEEEGAGDDDDENMDETEEDV